MDELTFTAIPASMRPSQSVVDHVKATVNDLISSALCKLDSLASEDVKGKIHADGSEDVDSRDEEKEEVTVAPSPVHHQRTKEAYNARVKSFTLSLWCGKPLCLSPPLLAQYGWKCVGEDIIKCCTCSAILTLHLPWPNARNYHSTCEDAQRKILEGHMKICAWPSNPAGESFLNPFNVIFLTQEDKDELILQFFARAKRLYKLGENLPHISTETQQDLKLDDSVLARLWKLCDFDDHRATDDLHKAMCLSATSLALCGWDTALKHQLPSIHCNETGRSVGLWNFVSVAVDDDASSTCAKRRKIDDVQTSLTIEQSWFHPIKQHHVWSPWIVSFNSHWKDIDSPLIRKDMHPGWALLCDLLINSFSESDDENNRPESCDQSASAPKKAAKTPPRLALQQAKKILNEWSSV